MLKSRFSFLQTLIVIKKPVFVNLMSTLFNIFVKDANQPMHIFNAVELL